MPTASKLVAALCLAALAWLVSQQIRPLLPEGTAFGWFNHVNAALGIVVGWRVVGARAGRGYGAAVSNGFTGGVVLVFWGLLLQSAYKMFENSTRLRYDGAFEAFAAVFQIMSEYALIIATPIVIAMLVVGSASSGIVSEIFHPKRR